MNKLNADVVKLIDRIYRESSMAQGFTLVSNGDENYLFLQEDWGMDGGTDIIVKHINLQDDVVALQKEATALEKRLATLKKEEADIKQAIKVLRKTV
jgi:hypothetical protein